MKNVALLILGLSLLLFSFESRSQCSSPVSLPYFNGFENDTIGAMPQCLTYTSPGANSYCRVLGGGWQGTKSLYFEGTAGPGYGQGWLFFPAMNLDSGKVFSVSVQYRNGSNVTFGRYDYPVNLRYGTSPTVAAMTNFIGSTYLWPNIYTALNGSIKTNGGQFYIGLQFSASYDVPVSLIIDNFSVYEVVAPPCPLPVRDLTVFTDGIDLTKTEIKWKKPAGFATDDVFEWELRTTADPGSGNNGLVDNSIATDTSISLTNLNQNTRYYIHVRAKCADSTNGNWAYIRFKTSSPEVRTMAINIPVNKYENNPTASGPVNVPDFAITNFSVWYSFTPESESNTLQIRNKRATYGGFISYNVGFPVSFDIYREADNILGDSLIAASLPKINTHSDSLCYIGTCIKYPMPYSGGDYPMPVLIPGKKHLIRFKPNTLGGGFYSYEIKSFDASIFKNDVWFGRPVGGSVANINPVQITALNNWNAIRSETGYKEDYKMFAEINPSGRSLGNINGQTFRYSAKIGKDIYGNPVFDRVYKLTSTIPPNGNIKIRLYFTQQELQRFTDSTGELINNLRITQNNDPLYSPTDGTNNNYLTSGTQITPTTGTYDVYKYLEFETDKLGTFYISAIRSNTICPGSNTFFVSGNAVNGNTYQWQVNTGSGFSDITNNAIYSGTINDTLKLNAPLTALYGYKYRSVINGTTYSPEYVLKFAVNWTGNTSTAWENATNWSCGVLPDENTDVMVNAGLSNYPLVNANAVCGSLKLMPGTLVTVKTRMKLDVKRKN